MLNDSSHAAKLFTADCSDRRDIELKRQELDLVKRRGISHSEAEMKCNDTSLKVLDSEEKVAAFRNQILADPLAAKSTSVGGYGIEDDLAWFGLKSTASLRGVNVSIWSNSPSITSGFVTFTSALARVSWEEARSVCVSLGGNLAHVTNEDENKELKEHLTSIPGYKNYNEPLWLGGQRESGLSQEWVWDTSFIPKPDFKTGYGALNSLPWGSKSDDGRVTGGDSLCKNGSTSETERGPFKDKDGHNCLYFTSKEKTWHNGQCDKAFNFVCRGLNSSHATLGNYYTFLKSVPVVESSHWQRPSESASGEWQEIMSSDFNGWEPGQAFSNQATFPSNYKLFRDNIGDPARNFGLTYWLPSVENASQSILESSLTPHFGTQEEAHRTCNKLGGHLAQVHSQQQNDEILPTRIPGDTRWAWMGGDDNDTEGLWKWANDASMFSERQNCSENIDAQLERPLQNCTRLIRNQSTTLYDNWFEDPYGETKLVMPHFSQDRNCLVYRVLDDDTWYVALERMYMLLPVL
jgi:hypothetical protein